MGGRLRPFFWGILILIVSQVLSLLAAFQQKAFWEERRITLPEVSLEVPIIYFFGAVIVLGLVLFLIPPSKLRVLLRVLFLFLFSWGLFVLLAFSLPLSVAVPIALAAGLVWFWKAKIWWHDLLLVFALTSVGSVFGFMLSPWTAMAIMGILSVYDILAVRFGYMMWMVKKMSASDTLPAFVIPRGISDWNLDLRRVKLEGGSDEREFSLLGGGDIGFPLLLIVSVFLNHGFMNALVMALFSVLGLVGAYWIQTVFLKGKPMPALPPISLASLIGLLVVYLL